MKFRGNRTGYFTTDTNALAWIPPGWRFSPPVLLSPHGCSPRELEARALEHANRIASGQWNAQDWPPYLICHFRSRTPGWRCVRLDPFTGKRGKSTWHMNLDSALDAGREFTLRCAERAHK